MTVDQDLVRPITYFGQSCAQASTIQASFLDVSSSSSTDNSGRSEFLLTDFICSTETSSPRQSAWW